MKVCVLQHLRTHLGITKYSVELGNIIIDYVAEGIIYRVHHLFQEHIIDLQKNNGPILLMMRDLINGIILTLYN